MVNPPSTTSALAGHKLDRRTKCTAPPSRPPRGTAEIGDGACGQAPGGVPHASVGGRAGGILDTRARPPQPVCTRAGDPRQSRGVMRALRWHGPRDLRLEDVEDPGAPGPTRCASPWNGAGSVAPMSRSTPTGPRHPSRAHPLTGLTLPMIVGHEVSGGRRIGGGPGARPPWRSPSRAGSRATTSPWLSLARSPSGRCAAPNRDRVSGSPSSARARSGSLCCRSRAPGRAEALKILVRPGE